MYMVKSFLFYPSTIESHNAELYVEAQFSGSKVRKLIARKYSNLWLQNENDIHVTAC